jgi:hypothetical protein
MCQASCMPRRNMHELVAEAIAIEQAEAQAAGTLGYMARVLAQTSLPYRDPGDIPGWGRRNGTISLGVQPGVVFDEDGQAKSIGYPYGVIPRLLLAWLSTEAVRTKERRLVLGNSLSAFMQELGLIPSGGRWGSIVRLRTQMERLFLARVVCRYEDPRGAGASGTKFEVADHYELWWRPREAGQLSLLPSYIELSERFFSEVVDRPIPIDLRVLHRLRGSALRLDIYCWLTYRMSYLYRRTEIPWELLRFQFGSNRANTKQGRYRFREDFEKQLIEVLTVYRAANVEVADRGLVLLPSRPHIRPR